jgi:hypothetical protein
MNSIQDTAVAEVFAAYPPTLRERLLALRSMIFAVASKTEGVGKLQETLKWGEPAYVTAESGSGTTMRINRHKNAKGRYAIYFHCQTTLIGSFRVQFPDTFEFEGNRALIFNEDDQVPARELMLCIAMALSYHNQRKTRHGIHDPAIAAR